MIKLCVRIIVLVVSGILIVGCENKTTPTLTPPAASREFISTSTATSSPNMTIMPLQSNTVTLNPKPSTMTQIPAFTRTSVPSATIIRRPSETIPASPSSTSVASWTPEAKPGVSFADSGQRLGAGGNVLDAALGDLDGDGDLDAVIANNDYEAGNALLLNDGYGVFSVSEQSFGRVSGVALGDLDGDDDLDVFTVSLNRAGRVWLNDAGVFSDNGQMLSTVYANKVALGDLDGDGDLDAFVARQSDNMIWLNDGQGQFSDSGQSLGDSSTEAIALGDLDGDGDLDALTGGWDEAGIIWLNDGQGILIESGKIPSPQTLHITDIALGDVDADGDLDAFLASCSDASAKRLWLNAGGVQGGMSGDFIGGGPNVSNHCLGAIALGDLDKDGDLDAFIGVDTGGADGINSGNTVWLNEGGAEAETSGVFTDSGLRLGEASSRGVVLGDMDGDGDIDALVINREDFSVPSSHPQALITSKVWFNTSLIVP